MAVYLDNQIKTGATGNVTHELIAWHHHYAVLAVGSYSSVTGGEVNLFYEQGDRTLDTPVKKADCHVTALEWHPQKRILVVGWSNGLVTTWNTEDRGIPADTQISEERAAINCIGYSTEGSRIIFTDAAGSVVIYKLDFKAKLIGNPFSKTKVKEPICCVILKPSVEPTANKLALAAEDPDALDTFVNKKDSTRPLIVPNESCTFFLGGTKGGVYCVRESGSIQDGFDAEKGVIRMLFYRERNQLITILEDLTLCQHSVATDCSLEQLVKVKLSGKSLNVDVTWAGTGVLAFSTNESVVRMWDMDNQDNFVLNLEPGAWSSNDVVTCISYSNNRTMLAAGTQSGQIAMWKKSSAPNLDDPSAVWKSQSPCTLHGSIIRLQWAVSASSLAACTSKDVFILREQLMSCSFKDQLAVVQVNQNLLSVLNLPKIHSYEVKLHLQPKGLCSSQQFLAAWDGKTVTVLEMTDSGSSLTTGTFASTTNTAVIYGQGIYVVEPGKVQARTFQGTVKQVLPLAEEEGDVVCMDVCGNFLAVATSNGFIRVFDVSRREAKQQFHPKYLAESITDYGRITAMKLNCSGNRIACIVKLRSGSVDPRLYIWEAESDVVNYFNFYTGKNDQDDYEKSLSSSKQRETKSLLDVNRRFPVNISWDTVDNRFLVCEGAKVAADQTVAETNDSQSDQPDTIIASFFVTPDFGILIQDAFPMSPACEKFFGVSIPYMYFTRKAEFSKDLIVGENISVLESSISKHIIKRVCRDFVGLENADKATREAMTNFSFFLTIGNLDEAFKAVKLIKSESVWENMAQMCVKTQRTDVAAVCLGNMCHARGARALREAMAKYPEKEVHLGVLAMQLGMTEDAERLFQSCNRYDLLNQLYQMTSNWKKALDIAGSHDRVHLRNTYYAYAKYLENIGAVQGAVDCYEKAGTHQFEVPRMLFDNPSMLEMYVKKAKDPYLRKWWAQYLESVGELNSALQYYSAAEDYLAVVRLHCYLDNLEKAAEVANETGDKAACYHLARQYEGAGHYKEAVQFFNKAHAYSSAIRLCREHGMDDHIAQLALMSSDSDMIEAAKFYETKPGKADKAVMLYHKAGMFGKALELAFKTEQFSALDLIAADLDEKSDPKVLERCAEFFMKNQQYLKAAQLLAYAKRYREAIELCSRKNVPITEKLVEQLTPTKDDIPDNVSRNKLLETLADCCMEQGHYHYAAKKFTEAGSTTQAMRALLKSGDTEKIVMFANRARNKEIFIMAGNYLQTTDWKNNADVITAVINFYKKAAALEHLASFYDACAQAEIDEYRDYGKALDALTEALKCNQQARGRDPLQIEEKNADLNKKIQLVKQFLGIRGIYESNPTEAVRQLQELAKVKDVNSAVRLGDIYAVLVVHNVKKENYQKALQFVEELKSRLAKVDVSHFVKPEVIARIYKELGMPMEKSGVEETNADESVPETNSLRRKLQQSVDED